MRDEVLKYLRRTARRILLRRIAEAVGVGIVISGLAASITQIVFWAVGLPHRGAGAILFASGALIGAIVALVRGVSVRRAAMFVDLRLGLDERLTTAAELALADDRRPAATCIYDQAIQAVRAPDRDPVSLWVRTRVTAAAAMLSVLLCGALAMLPQRRGTAERIVDALPEMSAEAAEALAREFARAAAAGDPDAELLNQAARATRQKDPQTLAKILADLQKRGVRLMRIIKPDVLALATSGGSDAGGTPATQPTTSPNNIPDNRHAGGVVHVWDPLYDKVAAVRNGAGPPDGNGDPPVVAYNDAWSAARARAGNALKTAAIPPEYRKMVRDFFGEQ